MFNVIIVKGLLTIRLFVKILIVQSIIVELKYRNNYKRNKRGFKDFLLVIVGESNGFS
jgi:hypothetical protein